MDTEIELKLLVFGDVKTLLEQSYFPSTETRHHSRQMHLFNQYFDSADKQLSKNGIGFRIRSHDGELEQTIKTSGSSIGGLHKRPEYNIPLETNQPDLSLFNKEIWPDDLNINQLQEELESVFSTDFVRQQYLLECEDDSLVELVIDSGYIKAGTQKQPINEIELELKQGEPVRLFDVAEQLAELMPMQIGILSKAARGFMLAEDRYLKPRKLDRFLSVNEKDTCETGFIKAVETALEFWQHHENSYLQNGKINTLKGMLQGMQLLLQALTVYLPQLQCESLLRLHKQLLLHINQWFWLEHSFSLKDLRSSKGPYRKRLAKNDELLSFLRGLSEGLLTHYKPADIIRSQDNCKIQLAFSRLLIEKPWRKESNGSQSKLTEHAKAWLSQGWMSVMQGMPENRKISTQDYLFQQSILRQTLFNGFLFGKLFSDQRDNFRAPWLDLLEGIADLKTLVFLKQKMQESDVEARNELLIWADEKIANLQAVMERSRKVAFRNEPYW